MAERETQLARGQVPPVARATVDPYVDAMPGPFYYQRAAHPVGVEAERILGELEGGHALLFSSGTGAATALILALLKPGATVAIADGGYWGTVALLEGELGRWGLQTVAFDQTGEPPNADLVWLEPCANPMMSFPDLDVAIAQAHAAGALVVVDNTVLSPMLLRPLEHGADFVLHSATKILAGHHDALIGVVSCARAEDHARLQAFRGASGIVAAPDPAWLMLRGMKTLALRVAAPVGQRPGTGPPAGRASRASTRVRYPGLGPDPVAARYVDAFGPLLSFDVADAEQAAQVEKALTADRERDQPGRRRLDARGPGPLGARRGCPRDCFA